MADLNYIESGYFTPEQGYYTYIADVALELQNNFDVTASAEIITSGVTVEASGGWSSAAGLVASVGKITNAESTMTAEFTQVAYGARERDIDLFAFSEAAIAIQVEVIRDLNIAATAVFDIATDGRVYRDLAAEANSIVDFAVDAERSRAFQMETQAAFSIAAELGTVKEGNLTLSTTASLTATISHIEGVDIVLEGFAEVSATADKIKNVNAALTTAASLTASANKKIGLAATLPAAFTVTEIPRPWQFKKKNSNAARVDFVSPGKFGSNYLRLNSVASVGESNAGYVDYFVNDDVNLSGSDQLLVEFWIFGVSGSSTGYGTTIIAHRADDKPSWRITNNNTGKVGFVYSALGSTEVGNLTSNSLIADQWNHVLVSATTANTSIFINGTKGLSTTGPSITFTSNVRNILRFGRNNDESTGGNTRIDEVRILKGPSGVTASSVGYNIANSTITVPTERFWNADSSYTRGLWHFDGTYADDIGVIETFNVAMASAFAVTAIGERFVYVPAEAALTSQSTLTANLTVTNEAQAVIESEFTQAARIDDNTKEGVVATSAEFNQTVDANIYRDITSSLDSEFTQTTQAVKSVTADISTEAVASELVAAAKIGDFLVTCEIAASIELVSDVVYSGASDAVAEVTVDANVNVLTDNNLILADSFSAAIVNDRIRSTSVTASSQFTQVTDATIVSVNAIDMNTSFVLNGSVMRIVGVDSALTSETSINAEINLTRDFNVLLAAEAAFNASVNATLAADIALESNSSLNVIISHIEGADIVAENFASMSIQAEAGMFGSAALESTFAQTADNVRVRFADSAFDVSTEFTAQVNEVVPLHGSLSSVTVQETLGNVAASALANIAATSTVSCIISHIEGVDIVVDSFAAIAADVKRIRGLAAAQTANTSVAVTGNKVVQLSANTSADTAMVVTATFALEGAGNLTATSTVNAQIGVVKQLASSISGAMTFQANVMEIDIDSIMQNVYVVPPEDREWTISREIWSRNIAEETREYII